MSAGRPINTELHSNMKRTRNIFHFDMIKCKKAEENIKKSNLFSAYLSEGGDLFKEIKETGKTNM